MQIVFEVFDVTADGALRDVEFGRRPQKTRMAAGRLESAQRDQRGQVSFH